MALAQIQLRRDTETNWSTENPILAQGEIGIEFDDATEEVVIGIKIGNGVDDWNTLVYFSAGSGGGSVDWGDIVGTLSDQTDLQTALDAKLPTSYLDTDGTLAANSDAKIASQKATKTYVDTAVTGLLDFKGATNCSTNPNYPAASKGDAYVVSVAGKIGGASGKSVDISDVYLATADNAGGTEASVGTSWIVLEHNLEGAMLKATYDTNNNGVVDNSEKFNGLAIEIPAVNGYTPRWDAGDNEFKWALVMSFNDGEGDPAPVGTAADGTSTHAARRDHVHVGVNGPSSAVADRLAAFDGTTGKLLKDSGRLVQSGTEVITCNSGTANKTVTITFPVAFSSAPLVFFSPGPSGNFTAAEMPLIVRGDILSTTQVGVFIRTVDGGNWAANRTLNLQWLAVGT